MYTTILEFGQNGGWLYEDRVSSWDCKLTFSTPANPGTNAVELSYVCSRAEDHAAFVNSIRGKEIKRVKYESTEGSILVYVKDRTKPYQLRFSDVGLFKVEYKLEYHS